jgi:hypothetical protein
MSLIVLFFFWFVNILIPVNLFLFINKHCEVNVNSIELFEQQHQNDSYIIFQERETQHVLLY